MNSITKKVVSSLTGLALALPLMTGVAFAEDAAVETMSTTITQTCVDARTAADDALIAAKNALHSSEISAIQAHKAGLIAALALTDVTAKKAAFKKAETDQRTSMQSAMQTFRTATKASMEAVKTACGKPAMKDEGRMMMKNHSKNPKAGVMNKMMNVFKKKGPKNFSGSLSNSR